MEMSPPARIMSPTGTFPVAKAMALGGVETGMAMANEQARAVRMASCPCCAEERAIAIGMMRFAVAVLLMKVESPRARKATEAERAKPLIWARGRRTTQS